MIINGLMEEVPVVAPLGISSLMQCEYAGPTGIRCSREIIDTSERWCALHCPADELDLSSFHATRLRAARYRIAQALPDAADTMVEVMSDKEGNPANRAKAAAEVLDRGGLPRIQATVLQGDITTRSAKTAGQLVTERLAALASRTVDAEDELFPAPALVPALLPRTTVDAEPDPTD